MYLLSIFTDIQAVPAHVHARYEAERMSLPGVPKLNGIVPAGAYQLVRGFGIETRAENSGFMAVHDIRRVAED